MKFHVLTYGCQMNVYDSHVMTDLLTSAGHTSVDTLDEAELVLVNTCAIRDSAEQRVHGQLGHLKRLKREGACRWLGICGCMAQNHGETLLQRHAHLDLVMGTGEVERLPELVAELERGAGPLLACTLDRDREAPGHWPLAFAERPATLRLPVFVSVQKGCNHPCTYCVVPAVRGPERYRPLDDVLAEVERVAQWGAGEITLIGQTINAYRHQDIDFARLLGEVARSTTARIRFATSHPRYFNQDVIDAIAAQDNVVEYIHLPVQSGSNRVLKRMARLYKREDYLDIVRRIRTTLGDALEGVALTSDLIVGFPDETDEDFAETMSLLKEVRWDGLYSFKYSPRPDTVALRFGDPVPDEVKGERLKQVQAQHQQQMDEIYAGFVGREVEVVVEAVQQQQARGRSRTHHIVCFPPPAGGCRIGDIVRVRVQHARPYTMKGVPLPATDATQERPHAVTGSGR